MFHSDHQALSFVAYGADEDVSRDNHESREDGARRNVFTKPDPAREMVLLARKNLMSSSSKP